jgi:hypothetical protein
VSDLPGTRKTVPLLQRGARFVAYELRFLAVLVVRRQAGGVIHFAVAAPHVPQVLSSEGAALGLLPRGRARAHASVRACEYATPVAELWVAEGASGWCDTPCADEQLVSSGLQASRERYSHSSASAVQRHSHHSSGNTGLVLWGTACEQFTDEHGPITAHRDAGDRGETAPRSSCPPRL